MPEGAPGNMGGELGTRDGETGYREKASHCQRVKRGQREQSANAQGAAAEGQDRVCSMTRTGSHIWQEQGKC